MSGRGALARRKTRKIPKKDLLLFVRLVLECLAEMAATGLALSDRLTPASPRQLNRFTPF
jgi:hypothetical protein